MTSLFKFIPFLMVISACSNGYTNQKHYTLAVGEKIKIFYSTNSCCQYCVTNENELTSVLLINDITVDQEDGCAGCSYTGAFVFEGIKKGTDTIYLNMSTASQDCYVDSLHTEFYIVSVQ